MAEDGAFNVLSDEQSESTTGSLCSAKNVFNDYLKGRVERGATKFQEGQTFDKLLRKTKKHLLEKMEKI